MAKKKQEKAPEDNAPVGRPSKYDPMFCELLIEHMSEGYSFESFAGEVRVDRDTVYEWANAHQEFSDAKKRGRALQLKANEKLIRDIAKFGDGNATAAIFILKNCHPKEWRDRKELDLAPTKSMTDEELLKEAEDILARKKGL
jgi:hypothetical protein